MGSGRSRGGRPRGGAPAQHGPHAAGDPDRLAREQRAGRRRGVAARRCALDAMERHRRETRRVERGGHPGIVAPPRPRRPVRTVWASDAFQASRAPTPTDGVAAAIAEALFATEGADRRPPPYDYNKSPDARASPGAGRARSRPEAAVMRRWGARAGAHQTDPSQRAADGAPAPGARHCRRSSHPPRRT